MAEPRRFEAASLEAFVRAAFAAIGADAATGDAATRAMMHASRLGVDSHGVRLVPHYLKVLEGGRVAKAPQIRVERRAKAVAVVDADHAIGHLACFRAMEEAVAIARECGIGAVSIRNQSHMGAAGAYALWAAEQGCIGFLTANSDAIVTLHEGRDPFHGTSPIAWGVPVPGQKPWLLDMATSAIPFNRVLLYRSLGKPLPPGVAVNDRGLHTTDPHEAAMLSPVGGDYAYKGAGLAGLVEILSTALTGMRLGTEIYPMNGPDISTPREMGGFALAMDPYAFIERETYTRMITKYLETVRAAAPAEGASGRPMAPGDREWAVERDRLAHGVPVDPDTVAAFEAFAVAHRLTPPVAMA